MAQAAIDAHAPQLGAELRPLDACTGQVLRQDVFPERDNPHFDRVCMDGIAIDSGAFAKGLRRFKLQSTQPAGAPPVARLSTEDAVEVMTGAVLPGGADCVIPQEEY